VPVHPLPAPSAPTAIGPYAPAVRAGDWVIVSGQIAIDPGTGKLVDGDVRAQTDRVMTNLRAVLDDCGLRVTDLAKTTLYVTDMANFPKVNEVYAEALGDHRPARATVEVAALPLGALVLIEAWAYAPESETSG
jgi:2-iminobutanoate/2-iminopropanoate deaminase